MPQESWRNCRIWIVADALETYFFWVAPAKGYNRLDPDRVNFKFLKYTITGIRAYFKVAEARRKKMEADDPDFEPADGWDDYVDRYLEDVRPSVYDGIDPEFDLGLKVVPPYAR